jgi:serpin B
MNEVYLSFLNAELGTDTAIQVANRLYANKNLTISEPFKAKLAEHFHSQSESLDFRQSAESAAAINDWISSNTHDKIRNVIDKSEISEQLGLLLVNAIYLKARWAHLFEEGLTKKEDFYLKDGSVRKVDMMELRRKNFKLIRNPYGLKANAIEIPYSHYTLSLTILLPDKDDQLDEIIGKLDANTLNGMLRTEKTLSTLVNLQLPKFKFESKFDVFLKILSSNFDQECFHFLI